jgi:hypothetical protein
MKFGEKWFLDRHNIPGIGEQGFAHAFPAEKRIAGLRKSRAPLIREPEIRDLMFDFLMIVSAWNPNYLDLLKFTFACKRCTSQDRFGAPGASCSSMAVPIELQKVALS